MQTYALKNILHRQKNACFIAPSALCTPSCLATYLLPCVTDARVQFFVFVFIHIHFKDKKAKILERASQSPDLNPTGNLCTEFKTVQVQEGL